MDEIHVTATGTAGLLRQAQAIAAAIERPTASEAMKRCNRLWLAQWETIAAAGPAVFTLAPVPTPAERRAALKLQRQEAALQKAANVRYHASKRRTTKMQRTPAWADTDAIRAIYAEAQRLTVTTGTPYHVDHEIPLQGKLVSGLHVENNLQILPGPENCRKNNRFEVEV